MKRILLLALGLLLVAFVLLPAAAQADDKTLIIDDLGRMTEEERTALNAYANHISSTYHMDVTFYLVADTYAPDLYLIDHVRQRYLHTQKLGPDGFALAHDINGKLWSMVSFGKAKHLMTDDLEERFWNAYAEASGSSYDHVLGYLAETEAYWASLPGETLSALEVDPAYFTDGSGRYVLDETGTLTPEQIAALNEKAAAFTEKRSCGMYIWIVDLVPEEYAQSIDDMEVYADAFYAHYNLGYGAEQNGLLLLLETGDIPGERDYLLNSHGAASETIDSSRREYILDEMVPFFKEGFRTGSFYETADMLVDKVDSQFAIVTTIYLLLDCLAVTVIPLLVAWQVCKRWKRKMNTSVPAREADYYIPKDGFHLVTTEDRFLYTSTTQVKIDRSASSSSGGSSSSSSGRSSGGKV